MSDNDERTRSKTEELKNDEEEVNWGITDDDIVEDIKRVRPRRKENH